MILLTLAEAMRREHAFVPLTALPQVIIRPIRPDDRTLLAEGLTHLSPETVYRRFLSPKPRFSSKELLYLTEVDMVDHVALVAIAADDPDDLVGVGRFIRLVEDPRTAEVAIVIRDSAQGQGLGKRLGLRLADLARERGIERFSATMLSDNVAAHRLFEAISDRLVERHDGAIDELLVELGAAA